MRKLLLILFLFQVAKLSAQAPLVHGAEIYYDKIGQTTYKVTAQVYRYCSSGPLNGIKAYVIADTFKIPLQMKRVSISRINDTCKNPCQNTNAVGNKGFERHVFVDTVNFNSSPFDSISKAGLCQVMFAIHDQLREPSITTHELHNNMFYIESMANICLQYNNYHSPKFSFEPRFLAPCNQPLAYTPAPIDTMEYDSLGFELDAVQYNFQKNVTYIGNFTKSIPMTPYCPPNPGVINCRGLPGVKPPRGIYFDAELCQLIFTPTKCDEIGNIAFKVSEYRRDSTGKFKLIGYVKREMTITVGQYPDNLPPMLSGNAKYAICGNNQICFNSKFYDDPFLPKQTKPDTVRINWNAAIPGSNLKLTDSSAREKTTQFCWTSKPHYTNERLYFGIQAYDKKCNAYISSYNYYIQTRQETKYTTSKSLKTCGKILFSAIPLDKNEILKGSISVSSRNKGIYTTSKMQDSVSVPFNDTFYIRYTLSSSLYPNCNVNKVDTVIVKNAINEGFYYAVKDTSVCKSFPAVLKFSPAKNPNLFLWEWFRNDTLINISDTLISAPIYFKSKYLLKLYDDNGCQISSDRTFTPTTNTFNLLPISSTICDSLLMILTPTTSGLKSPIQFKWKLRGIDTFSSSTIKFFPKNFEKVNLLVIDDNHCQVKDSAIMIVNELPDFWMDKSKKTHTICQNGLATIAIDSFKGKAPYSIRWKVNGADSISYNNKKALTFQLNKASQIKVSITDAKGCIASDSMIWEKPDTVRLMLLDTGLHCQGMPFTVIAKVYNSTFDQGKLSWSVNGNVTTPKPWDTVKTFTGYKNLQIKATYYGRYDCGDDTTINTILLPKPSFKILGDTVYNKANYIQLSSDKPFKHYNWSDGKQTRDNGFWAYLIGPPAQYSIKLEVTDSNGCKSEETHRFRTNGLTGIDNHVGNLWHIYPNPGSGQFTVEALEDIVMEVYSSDGRLVKKLSLNFGLNQVDLSELSTGYYHLRCGNFGSVLMIE
jgi:hypothetical protein